MEINNNLDYCSLCDKTKNLPDETYRDFESEVEQSSVPQESGPRIPQASGPRIPQASKPVDIPYEKILRDIYSNYDEKNTFIIFTTGLRDEGIFQFWTEDSYYNYLLKLIPSNFTRIKFLHFDPFFNFSYENFMNKKQIINDIEKSSERIVLSEFYNIGFPFELFDFSELNHLLIDFAHIFIYNYKYQVLTSDHYSSYQNYKKNILSPNLKSVYFGYRNDNLALSKFVKIEPNGNLNTYIDKLIFHQIEFDQQYPYSIFDDYYRNFTNDFIKKYFRPKYPKDVMFFDDNITKNKNISNNIFNLYLSKLFNNDFSLTDLNDNVFYVINQELKKLGKPI